MSRRLETRSIYTDHLRRMAGKSVTAFATRMPLAFLPTSLQHKTNLPASGLHDVKVRVVPKLKEAECIVLAILSNCRSVVVAALNDHTVIVAAFLA